MERGARYLVSSDVPWVAGQWAVANFRAIAADQWIWAVTSYVSAIQAPNHEPVTLYNAG